jgi:hypothetical protein
MAYGREKPEPYFGKVPGLPPNQGVNSAGSISNAQAGAALTKSERKKARGTAGRPGQMPALREVARRGLTGGGRDAVYR